MTFPALPARQPDSPTLPLSTRGAQSTTGELSLVSQATEAAQRYRAIERLGLPTEAHPEFDEIARQLSERTGFLYGIVNLFLEWQQTFIGLHQPPPGSGYVILGRTMSLDHGYCPEVMDRRKALPLPDVHASPRFAGNHVVDAIGIRAYFGVPLISDGICIGTACVIDPERRPQSDARRTQDTVKGLAREVLTLPSGRSGH
ncbi:GAF domain-containing protein [Streptomyces sp. NPDC006658]|uniref:GAF domain-containing protein n=1 Tax=Streptomyces sp. NPDC006658 TaxID=3156900 RepID=UPI0033ED1FA7